MALYLPYGLKMVPCVETTRAGGGRLGRMTRASIGNKPMIVEGRTDLPRACGIGGDASEAKAALPGVFNQRHGIILVVRWSSGSRGHPVHGISSGGSRWTN